MLAGYCSVTSVPLDDRISVTLTGRPVKTRKIYRFTESGSSVSYGIHNNSVSNISRAINERVYKSNQNGKLMNTIKPKPGFLSRKFLGFRTKLFTHLPNLRPLTPDQFLDRYSGRKRERYARAFASLVDRPLTRRDSDLKSFVKAEKLNLSSKSDPCPRLIQPRESRYNACIGRLIAHGEKALFKAIDAVFGYPVVMKGKDSSMTATCLRANWDHMDDPVAVSIDFSRFDQHVSSDALKEEHKMWKRMCAESLPDGTKLGDLLRWQLNGRGYARCDDGNVRYTVDGCRMSGDMNTSSGNIYLACALFYAFLMEKDRPFRFANNGDDCIIFLNRRDLSAVLGGMTEWFVDGGFTLVAEEAASQFEDIEFCQAKPVQTSNGWLMVRNPHTSLAKDATSLCKISCPKVCAAWLNAVSCGGDALTKGVPVVNAFYTQFPRSSAKVHLQELERFRDSGLIRMRGAMALLDSTITPEARYSFWKAFGILPDEQKELEESFTKNKFKHNEPVLVERLHQCITILDVKNPKLLQ